MTRRGQNGSPISKAIKFGCVGCGRCCHNLRLPLSMAEAAGWLRSGGTVQILVDASIAIEPTDEQLMPRSFAARSGDLNIRVRVTLVAYFTGACPRLLEDMRCGRYDERPQVCRIYPAERRPGVPLDPNNKLCPSEAWDADQPSLSSEAGVLIAPDAVAAIERMTAADVADQPKLAALMDALDVRYAALANEGFAVHNPALERFLGALSGICLNDKAVPAADWILVSNRQSTRRLIADASASVTAADTLNGNYLPFFPDE